MEHFTAESRDRLMKALGIIGPSMRIYELRHLKGLHDQKSHGKRGPLSVAGRIAKAVASHVSGDGKGESFDDFSTPHLRKLARDRGVKLKPRTHRDDVIKALIDHEGKRGSGRSATDVYDSLARGEVASAPPPPLADLMEHFKGQPSVNLANLDVHGEGNDYLYTHHIRDIPRSEMPQLPATVEGLAPFLDRLAREGVDFKLEKIDPRELQMVQSQLDSAKVAGIWSSMVESGWKEGIVMLASREGAIVDGHHRWAGAATASATGSPLKMHRLWIDMPIDDLLALAQEYSGERAGIGGK